MVTILNLLIILGFLFLLTLAIDSYNKLIFDKFKYRYFALRDRLALMVVDGKLKEDSWEYKELVNIINYHISTVETMSIRKVASRLFHHYSSSEEQRKFKSIKKKIDNEDLNEIIAEFLDVTIRLLCRNSRAQLVFIDLMSRIITSTTTSMPLAKKRFDTIHTLKGQQEIFS